MPYDDSPPPTRRARPLTVAAALAAVSLTAAGCGGGPQSDGAPPRPGADAGSPTGAARGAAGARPKTPP
ncbi:hypothetical protein [Streptomyces griseus]|uniref:hypothetical protein n=1 Tax=Streptomyces griseus TaxID=1911 RepID=UPI0036C109A8